MFKLETKDNGGVDLDAPLQEIKKEIGSVMSAVAELKNKNDSDLKKADGLTKSEIARIEKFVSDKLDSFATESVKKDQRIKNLEAALDRAAQGDGSAEAKKVAAERAKAFDAFLRNAEAGKKEVEILSKREIQVREAKGMSTDVNPDGGYLVRPEFSDFIVSRLFETSPLRRIANIETIGSKSLTMLIDDNEASAGWIGEGGTISETDTPEVGELEITAHKLYALPIVTTEMLEDAFFDVEGWLQRKVADKFARLENTGFVSGNGVKRPRGFTTYSAWSVAGAYERGKLEQVNTGSAAALTADGLIDLQNSLLEAYQANATFVMKRGTYGSIMKLKDGMQNYLFNVMLDKNTGLPTASLLTRPVLFADDMPAVGANNLPVAYGDFGVGYTIVDRLGMTLLRDPFTGKGFVKYFATKRTGGAVTNYQAIKLQKCST